MHKLKKLMEYTNKQKLSCNGTLSHKGNKSLSVFIWCSMTKELTCGTISNQIASNKTFPLLSPIWCTKIDLFCILKLIPDRNYFQRRLALGLIEKDLGANPD